MESLSLFTLFVWHFLFIRHAGPSHCAEGTMSEGHCCFYAFLLFMTLLDFFFFFSLHANLYRHPLECLGSGSETFSLWEGRLSALRDVDGDGSGGFTDMNPTNQTAVGTGARFVCRPVAAG